MLVQTLAQEEANRKKGRRISFFIHALLILLLIFWTLPFNSKNNIDTQFAVTIAFDNSISSASAPMKASSGRQRPKAMEVEKLETKPKKEVVVEKESAQVPEIKPTQTPKPTSPIFSEVLTEVSDVVAVDEDIPVEDPEPEIIPEPEPVIIPTSKPTIPSSTPSPSIEDILSDIDDEVSSDDGGIVTENTEAEPGDAGTSGAGETGKENGTGTAENGEGTGDGETGNDLDDGIGTGGAGDGEYDDSGDGIFGRKVVYRNYNMVKHASGKSGRISFKVCISRKGTVTYVELDELNTTITDRKIKKVGMNAMWDYKYEPDPNAPREECGKFTVIIDNFRGIRANN